MLARLCLCVLLVICAPLTVAQQGSCGTHGTQDLAPPPGLEHGHHAADSGAAGDPHASADTPQHACDDCDLACLAVCAATAAAGPARTLAALQRHTPQQYEHSAARRAAYQLALLRPPTSQPR
jgi:hypothetical protein